MILFRLREDNATEKKIRTMVRTRLGERKKNDPKHTDRLAIALSRKNEKMTLFERTLFHTLHRQFEGRSTLFLPKSVALARQIVTQLKALKGWIPT